MFRGVGGTVNVVNMPYIDYCHNFIIFAAVGEFYFNAIKKIVSKIGKGWG